MMIDDYIKEIPEGCALCVYITPHGYHLEAADSDRSPDFKPLEGPFLGGLVRNIKQAIDEIKTIKMVR